VTEEELKVGKVIAAIVFLVRKCRREMKGCGRDIHVSLSGASDTKTARGYNGESGRAGCRGTDKRN
jgi:hypothetical protein